MNQEQSLEVIRRAFAHVFGAVIVVEKNDVPDMPDEFVAKVYVRNDQLDAALGDDFGSIPRQAAIESGMSVEVALFNEMKHSTGDSATQS
jgi:hypothetical protein